MDRKTLVKKYDSPGKESTKDLIDRISNEILDNYDDYYEDMIFAFLVTAIEKIQSENKKLQTNEKVEKIIQKRLDKSLEKLQFEGVSLK